MHPVPALEHVRTVEGACQGVVDHLARDERLLPSVYLARGGRLRCQAAHGYKQVLDGMLPSTGVMGEAFRTGRSQLIGDVRDDPTFLAAASNLLAELALPTVHRGEVVGILNVESRRPLDAGQVAASKAANAALEAALERIGGPPLESAAQRLARAAAQLAALGTDQEIAPAALEAACDITGLDSGLLVCPHDGVLRAEAAAGPLGPALLAAPSEALGALCRLTELGSSVYSVAADGDAFGGLDGLHALGVRALAAVRLPGGGDDHGVLMVADARQEAFATARVELLELLASHVGSLLQTAAAMAELRLRAATDSLTGLGHHATFQERLTAERTAGDRLAVLLVDVDGFKTINDTSGHLAGDRALRTVAAQLACALRRGDEVFRIGGDEFAAIVRVADAEEAVGIGHRLRAAVAEAGLTVSIGVALPEDGESDAALLARADRALYAVKSAGRDGVSSTC